MYLMYAQKINSAINSTMHVKVSPLFCNMTIHIVGNGALERTNHHIHVQYGAAVAPGKDSAPTIEYWTGAAGRSSRLQHLLRCSSEPDDDTCISNRHDVDCIWGRYLDRPDTQA